MLSLQKYKTQMTRTISTLMNTKIFVKNPIENKNKISIFRIKVSQYIISLSCIFYRDHLCSTAFVLGLSKAGPF